MISAVSGQRSPSERLYYVYEDRNIKQTRKVGDMLDIPKKYTPTGMYLFD
jgi:hypothetical protein